VAPLPVIADTYRVALNWTNTANSMKATNVMHFQRSGSNSASLSTALDANVTQAMWGLVSSTASVHDYVITPLDGSSVSFPVITGNPAKYTGIGGAGDFIVQGASIIKMLTAKRGRSYRGRLYLPWVPEGAQSNGTLTAGSVTSVTNAWIAFHTAMTASSWALCIASYKLAYQDPVAALVCEPLIATQRRRLAR